MLFSGIPILPGFALATGARSHSLACLLPNMSPSPPYLTQLPTETLEYVLLHLPTRDVIKMEVVRSLSLFKLQLRRELFATGLIENPGNPCDLVQSRKLYEDYAIKSTHELHPDHASCRIYAKNLGRNILASHPMGDHGLGFLYIPPVTSRKPIDTWSILPFPFTLLCFAVYHPENLLAIDERDGE